MTTNQPRSFGQRLWWIIRTTFLIFILAVLATAILGGLGYAGYLGVLEIQRSNNSLAMRIDATFPLSGIAEAHALLEKNETIGKVALEID